MDENKSIEIPFGAKDSELKGWEYTIPEGMEAIIKDGKIIVREKESEDERIRKEIITYLSTIDDKGLVPYDSWIAWLEKQGEKKTAVTDFNAKDWYVSKVDGKIHDMTYNPADKVEPKFKVGDKIKYAGQPDRYAEKIIAIRNDAYYFSEVVSLPFIEQDKWELAEQKPVDKVEQNPAWSEEDESKRICACKFLDDAKHEINYAVNHKDDIDECITWLKSLKERYTWKPSDEQLAGIKCAIETLRHQLNIGDKRLNSLYEELSNLK